MTTAVHFYALAILVGAVVGGSQALSRSLYASLIPRHKSAEFFAFLTVGSKFTGTLGPAIFGWVSLLAGTSRLSILAIMAFFVIGIVLLRARGCDRRPARRAARRPGVSLGLKPVWVPVWSGEAIVSADAMAPGDGPAGTTAASGPRRLHALGRMLPLCHPSVFPCPSA